MTRSRLLILVVSFCFLQACTSSTSGTSNSPVASPSASLSPSPSPSPSLSPSPAAPLAVSSVPVHTGEVGLGYPAVTLGATGGTAPYAWSVAGGALPPGLSLSSGGKITGTSTTAGTFSFTVQVTDSASATATAPAKVTVFSRLVITKQPCAAQCVIGQGCVKCGGFGAVGGGAPPYLYRLVGGGVPPGMKWSGLGLSGPFPKGAYSMSVMVNDSLGASVTVGANWAIYAPASLKGGANCTGFSNTPPQSCSTSWSYSGGSPTTAPQVVVEKVCLPTGACAAPPTYMPASFSAKASGGVITITASTSVACNAPAYIATLTLALKDTTQCATTSLSNAVDLTIDLSNNC